MIRTCGLTKRFGSLTAVDRVDLDVREGDIYGFLGANGSGKTTTVRMLLGLVLATSGTVELLGRPMPRDAPRGAAAGRRAGRGAGGVRAPVRAGQPARCSTRADPDGPVARAAAAGRVDEALEQVGLGGVGRRPVKAYSLGHAAAARPGRGRCCASRELLVLDEPTNGLDPQGIREVRELLLAAATRRARRSSCPATCWPRSSSCAPGSGVLDRGRLVLQEQLAALRAPTGPDRRRTPDAAAVVALLDGGVERARRRPAGGPGGRPGRAERAAGRGRHPRCTSSGRSGARWRRSCTSAPARPGTGWSGRPVMRGRAGQAVPPAAHLGDDRCCSTRCPPWSRCCSSVTGIGARGRDRGRRSCRRCSPTGRCSPSRRWRSCCRCSCRSRSRSWPATRSPARRRPARCATCWSARSAGPGCWWPSSSPSFVFVAGRGAVVAVVGFVRRAAAARRPAAVAGDRQRVRDVADARPDRLADRAGDRLRGVLDARRRGDGAVPVHADRLAAGRDASARWRS